MKSLINQIKQRRLTLGLKQSDMLMRIGVSRQQYQRLESRGNPRLDTLELIAKGLNSELMLIPKEKRDAVLALLERGELEPAKSPGKPKSSDDVENRNSLADDPWQGLLGDDL